MVLSVYSHGALSDFTHRPAASSAAPAPQLAPVWPFGEAARVLEQALMGAGIDRVRG
jgi:hypothetical protein